MEYTTFRIFVYKTDNPKEPYYIDVCARNITEAVDKLVRTLDEDTFLCPATDGWIWYYIAPKVKDYAGNPHI